MVFASHAEALRVEGMDWGEKRDSVIAKIEKKGWTAIPTNYKQLLEADAFILSEPCRVRFTFTASLSLTSIQLTWETSKMGPLARESLIKRYGHPSSVNPGANHYEWLGSFKGEHISLDYPDDYFKSETVVVFQSGYKD